MTTPLWPSYSFTTTKNAGNPTFAFDSIPENFIKVGSTYWCVYRSWSTPFPWHIGLASASSPTGSWTAYGSNPVYEFSDVPWAPSGTDAIYAPFIMEEGGTSTSSTPSVGK